MASVQKYIMAWTTADGRRVEDQLFTAEHISHKLAELERAECREINIVSIDPKRLYEPEVFYTGGGIWLAAMWLNEHEYAIVDNCWKYCLSYYDDSEDEYEFHGMNMLTSVDEEDMTDADKAIWTKLCDALDREAE